MTAPKRPPEERLRLAVKLADQMVPSMLGAKFGLRMLGNANAPVLTQPDRATLRDLITDARKFDTFGDTYIPDLCDVMEAHGLDPDWAIGVSTVRTRYEALKRDIWFGVEDVDAPGQPVTPREAFELWVYGEHLHDDYDKEQRLARFSPHGQAFLRTTGHGYMLGLINLAFLLQFIIRGGLVPPLDLPPPPTEWITRRKVASQSPAPGGT